MASVTSLDKDLRKLRLEKYTPAAANEARQWIEDVLGEKLSSADLLQALKDGVALCRLVNLAVAPPGIKFKKSSMPFVQMENISQFLSACQVPPLSLHQHDMFLTVDLFEQKDPAQVLQCIGAFSRAAHAVNPDKFPSPIGPKITKPGTLTPPQVLGGGTRARGASIASDTSSAHGGVAKSSASQESSGWNKKEKEPAPTPAWNVTQYGYMGGASQGNLGISFGARRQVVAAGPSVPSLAEKERMRKEKIAEEERQRQEEQERRRLQLLADEDEARRAEDKLWEEKTNRLREEERRKVEQERRQWEEQERQWKLTEEQRRKEEEQAAAQMEEERSRTKLRSPVRLRGQFLSQYQAEQAAADAETEQNEERMRAMEQEVELARQREAKYERDRQGRTGPASDASAKLRVRSRSRPKTPRSPNPNNTSQLNRQESWTQGSEILHTKTKWHQRQHDIPEGEMEGLTSPTRSPRPLPDPNALPQNMGSPRPLPDPAKYVSPPRSSPQSRTDQFLAGNPAPTQATARLVYAREVGATEERDEEDVRRAQSQEATAAGGWASKSLLEREMEMERQRQRDWEAAQKETAEAAAHLSGNEGVDGIGGGIGGRWDVSQWAGYTGGDNQNKGSQGIGAGRRQVVGPRPLNNPI